MKLSVALCTYNGERYLSDQLASIRSQTRLPDELVVCDDASADATVAIIRDFAATAPFPVRLEINDRTLGSSQNFARAISLTSGDVVALADQDDVWRPHKLATLGAALEAAPDAGFAFSDASVADADLSPLGYGLWEALGFGPREQQRFRKGEAFACLLRRHRVTGATMAFRAAHREQILPIPADWVHDAWIALAISAVSSCVLVAEPLILYRQHAAQQMGGRKRGLYAQYLSAREATLSKFETVLRQYCEARNRISSIPGVSAGKLALLNRKIEHCARRHEMRLPGAWRVPTVLRELGSGNYHRFSLGWKMAAQDLFLAGTGARQTKIGNRETKASPRQS